MLVAGLLLVTNPLWLLPHEGDVRYTYERSGITVEGGSITYERVDLRDAEAERRNSLNPVGCQPDDEEGERACAFDRHLVDRAPVSVSQPVSLLANPTRPEFVRVGDAYYRRVREWNRTGTSRNATYAVRQVAPRTVLSQSAVNLTGATGLSSGDAPVRYRVAATGSTIHTFEELRAEDLGEVYRLDGRYYTVVVTDLEPVSHDGLEWLRYEVPRLLLALAGAALVGWSLLVAIVARREGPA